MNRLWQRAASTTGFYFQNFKYQGRAAAVGRSGWGTDCTVSAAVFTRSLSGQGSKAAGESWEPTALPFPIRAACERASLGIRTSFVLTDSHHEDRPRSDQESIQLRPLIFYGAAGAPSNSARFAWFWIY